MTDLTIGGSVRVADLVLPPGVTTEVDGEVAVVTGQPPRVATAAEGEEAALAEGAIPAPAGEEAAGADGASPAALVRRRGSGEARRGRPADLVVVGLGNPGEEFARTRHNVGADTVSLLADRHGSVRLRSTRGVRARLAEIRLGDVRVVLAVPLTYMNESGEAVGPLVRRAGLQDPGHLVVVHDELDLPPGRVRVKVGGGLAGHNGLRSVKAHLHSDAFVRVRMGWASPRAAAGARYVLRPPAKAERELLDLAVATAADAVEEIAAHGVEAAMNRFNV